MLIPFAPAPYLAKPTHRVISALSSLAKDPNNIIYVISGRDKTTLSNWFGHLPISLVAEHGFFMLDKKKNTTQTKWKALTNDPDTTWKDTIKPIFQYFTERTPGSYFEEKETSLTWHYRRCERKFGAFRTKELQSHLDKCSIPVRYLYCPLS